MVEDIEPHLDGTKTLYNMHLTSEDGSKAFQICSSHLQPCTEGAEGETMAAVEEAPAGDLVEVEGETEETPMG